MNTNTAILSILCLTVFIFIFVVALDFYSPKINQCEQNGGIFISRTCATQDHSNLPDCVFDKCILPNNKTYYYYNNQEEAKP